jgi:hypothetical protein
MNLLRAAAFVLAAPVIAVWAAIVLIRHGLPTPAPAPGADEQDCGWWG